ITRLRDVNARVLTNQGRGGRGAFQLGEGMAEVAAETLVEARGEEAVLFLDRSSTTVRVAAADPTLILPQQVVVLAEPHKHRSEYPPDSCLGELVFLPIRPCGTCSLGILQRGVGGFPPRGRRVVFRKPDPHVVDQLPHHRLQRRGQRLLRRRPTTLTSLLRHNYTFPRCRNPYTPSTSRVSYTLTNWESLVIGSFSPSIRSGCPGASVARPEINTTGRRGDDDRSVHLFSRSSSPNSASNEASVSTTAAAGVAST